MAGFNLEFDVAGDQQIMRGFSRFAEDIQDATEPFTQMAEDFRQIEKRQFDSEGEYGSGGWKPLSPNYAAWKSKFYPGRKILELSGLLRESVTDGNPWTIREIQPLKLRLGTKINYAIYHQKGTHRMPARPVIQFSEDDKTRWSKIMQAWLVRKSNQEFAGLMPDITRGQKAVRSI
jgi:phage gpG-like protein